MFQANFKNRSTQPQQINGERLRYTGRQLVDGVTHKQEAIVQLLYPVGVARVIHWIPRSLIAWGRDAKRLGPDTIVASDDLLRLPNAEIVERIIAVVGAKAVADNTSAELQDDRSAELHGSETASVL